MIRDGTTKVFQQTLIQALPYGFRCPGAVDGLHSIIGRDCRYLDRDKEHGNCISHTLCNALNSCFAPGIRSHIDRIVSYAWRNPFTL